MRRIAVCIAPYCGVHCFFNHGGVCHARTGGDRVVPGNPLVMLNGTVLDSSVAIPVEYVLLVNGPVAYTIQTPPSVTRDVLVADVGYGHGTTIMFTDGAGAVKDTTFPARIDVVIPIDEAQLTSDEVVPVELTVRAANADPVTVQGTSDGTTLRLSIHGQ